MTPQERYHINHREKCRESSKKWRLSHKKYCRLYYQRNKLAAKNRHMKSKYGISLATVETMLRSQKGLCAICEDELALVDSHVDHCHKAGHIRAILCRRCNNGLGQFRHSRKIIHKADLYLSKEILFLVEPTKKEEKCA
jgi:hypothetical protein